MSSTDIQLRNAAILVGIVTRNRLEKLKKTLEKCYRLGFRNVVVVDNSSGDGTQDYLRAQHWVHVIYNETNEGGAGGFNAVMRYFIEETSFQWLLTFDDDAYPDFTHLTLAKYLLQYSNPSRPGYALRVVYPDGELCQMNKPGRNVLAQSPFSAVVNFHIDSNTKTCEVEFASFVGLLLRRDTILRAGIVSKAFFIYSDDTYYTLFVSSCCGPLGYVPDLRIVHDCRRSSRSLKNHDAFRLGKDVTNKIVVIREFSRWKRTYIFLYLLQLVMKNPSRTLEIMKASFVGIRADLQRFKNEPIVESRRLEPSCLSSVLSCLNSDSDSR